MSTDPLIDALTGYDLLTRVLGAVRGRPLAPGQEPLDAVEGLGWLAELLLHQRDAWEAALDRGDADVRRRWERDVIQAGADLGVLRGVGALYRRWAIAAARRRDLDAARAAFARAADLLGAVVDQLGAEDDDPWDEPTRRAVWTALLRDHGDWAQQALDASAIDLALLHWSIVVEHGARGDAHALRALRLLLVERWIGMSEGVVAQGLARGVELGYNNAADLLLAALEVEPGAPALHLQLISVGVRSAMWSYALADLTAFTAQVERLRASARWLELHMHEHPDLHAPDEQIERLAQTWVCLARLARHPQEAVNALQRALALHPHHPTARRLLATALAALAARQAGAGRHDEARALVLKANAAGFPQSERWSRLSQLLLGDTEAPP